MEFFPANVMYKNIEIQGFRTFIKYQGKIHEIFSSTSQNEEIDDFNYWDEIATNRENYRDKIRFGIHGKEENFKTEKYY